MAMESDYSDVDSENSEVPYQPGGDEDDDEEYVEIPESLPKPKVRGSKRSKSHGINDAKPISTRKRSKEQGEEDFEEEVLEQISSPKRRNTHRGVPDEEDDNDETPEMKVPSEELESQPELPSDQVDIEEEIPPQAAVPDDDEELREKTEDSVQGGNRSKMLTDLLGDGSTRKSLNEEEIQLRRAENARKRKNLSEKRLEEEKQETINKLLRRRAGKSRSHLPREDDKEALGEAGNFHKPRRPYLSKGMNRTLRRRDGDLYCVFEKT